MTAVLQPAPSVDDEWDLDLTITPVTYSGMPDLRLPSGKDCDSGDGCGQTCQSACTNSGC
jgi:hypothetical protein